MGSIDLLEKVNYYGYAFPFQVPKPYQWTLATQEPTPIGSKPSLGPSMVPNQIDTNQGPFQGHIDQFFYVDC